MRDRDGGGDSGNGGVVLILARRRGWVMEGEGSYHAVATLFLVSLMHRGRGSIEFVFRHWIVRDCW